MGRDEGVASTPCSQSTCLCSHLADFKLRDSCIRNWWIPFAAIHGCAGTDDTQTWPETDVSVFFCPEVRMMNTWFFLNSILLGVGLAMDAFSVSIANGLSEHGMTKRRMSAIAGCYGLFQWAMPMIGWFCVHTISGLFSAFQKFIPWIALFLLLCIGGKMLLEGIRKKRRMRAQGSPRGPSLSRALPPRSTPSPWALRSPTTTRRRPSYVPF